MTSTFLTECTCTDSDLYENY